MNPTTSKTPDVRDQGFYFCLFSALMGRFLLECVDVPLQLLHKQAHVVSVADRMMYLNGQRQEASAVSFKELAHSEARQEELALVEDIDVEAGELQPGDHGDVEGVGRRALFGSKAGGLGIRRRIRFVAFQELAIILRKPGPDIGKVLVFLVEHGVHGVHVVVDAQPLHRQAGAELRHVVDGFGQKPDHRRVQSLTL